MLKAIRRAVRAFFDDGPPPPPVPAIIPPRPKGFFGTDPLNLRDRQDSWDAVLKVVNPFVFQRKAADISKVSVGVGMDGALDVKEVSFATDAAIDKSLYGVMGGSPMPGIVLSWFAAQSFIGYQACAILAQHWFIDKACTMPARDAIRNGYDVVRADGEKLTPKMAHEFEQLDKRFKIKNNCVEAVRNMRIFGVRVVLFEVESADPDYYVKPFNPDGVRPGSYKGISQVDPYWVSPELDYAAAADPASIHFYEPTYWRINGKRYHRSHLVVLTRNEVPDVLKPTYFYGGIPLPQQLYERTYASERTANEGPQLALTKRLTVIEGVDMAAAAADPTKLTENIRNLAYYRDNYGVHLLGGTEKLNQQDTSLTDVDVVIMTQFQLSCAIAEVPATKMLGTMPKGFNATGEYEESSYHEMLESVQEHDMEPIITRHHLLCIRSEIAPKFGIPVFGVTVAFAELDAETSKEHAERTKMEADRDLAWAQTGAIDGVDIRQRLKSDKESGYSGMQDDLPVGPTPRSVVQPGAPVAAPNTEAGATPTPAPAAPAPATGHDAALMSAVQSMFEAWRL
jgi:phage-related protein (TIGR01555 family)